MPHRPETYIIIKVGTFRFHPSQPVTSRPDVLQQAYISASTLIELGILHILIDQHLQIRNLTHISMGSWDELCLLCGVYSGPCDIVSKYGLDDVAKAIAAEIRPDDAELFNIVKDALLSSFSPDDRLLSYSPKWLPEGMGNGGYSTRAWIAVGCFNEDGEAPLRGDSIPDGRYVQVRRVRDGDGGDFGELLVTRDGEEVEENTYTVCSVRREEGLPNFFLCERCYSYLENWLDRDSLPPRSNAFPSASEPLSFASELYEIVNSRKARRGELEYPL